MQTELSFEQEDSILEEGLELGKKIRDYSYKQVINDTHTGIQRETVRNVILSHPEGVTDLEICVTTGISRSSVTARRNEIHNVVPVGIAKIRTYDGEGDRLNTLWGIDEGEALVSYGTPKKVCEEDDDN